MYIGPGEFAESNAQMVEKMVRLGREVTEREPAAPYEVREFLDLKGKSATDME